MFRLVKLSAIALLGLASSSVFATQGWFGEANMLVNFTNVDASNQAVPVNTVLTNTYSNGNVANTSFGADAGVGYELDPWRLLQFAFSEQTDYVNYESIDGSTSAVIGGASYNTLNFTYNAKSFALLTQAKLLFGDWAFRPFATGAVGVSWNYLNSYSETTAGGSAFPSPYDFGNNTEAAFAYSAGAGVSYTVTSYLACDLDYRYFNAGIGSLSPKASQENTVHLPSGTLSANMIELGFSFM